jgi:hypothetical protein
VRISDAQEGQIMNLKAEGENLNLDDLEAFYRWVDNAYEVLEFDPLLQQRFDQFCRSSSRSNFTRVCFGVWALSLALEDPSSYSKDHWEPFRRG